MNKALKLGIVGLGKLGAPMAAVFADAGYSVLGTDLNEAFVSAINSGLPPVEETNLADYIARNSNRIEATINAERLGKECDVVFLIVPTPSQADHTFSNEYLLKAIDQLGTGLKVSDREQLVVITSTTMPGSMDAEIAPRLEEASGRKIGDKLGLCYNPEFIALGSVIRDMLYPDLTLIGESSPKWGKLLEAIYAKSCKNSPTVRRMNFVNAELTKISINTYTTTKISYANMLSDICDQLENADAGVVVDAVGVDSRIGRKYLTPGVGFGGPCFPRDNKAFVAMAKTVGANATLAEATDTTNDYQLDRLVNITKSNSPTGSRIAILGLAYKPETSVVEASHGWLAASKLAQSGYDVMCFDPWVQTAPPHAQSADSIQSAMSDADTILITLPIFNWVDEINKHLYQANDAPTIIDPWRIVDTSIDNENITLVQLGRYQSPSSLPDTKVTKSA